MWHGTVMQRNAPPSEIVIQYIIYGMLAPVNSRVGPAARFVSSRNRTQTRFFPLSLSLRVERSFLMQIFSRSEEKLRSFGTSSFRFFFFCLRKVSRVSWRRELPIVRITRHSSRYKMLDNVGLFFPV